MKKLAFIGVGNMARATLSGIFAASDDSIKWSDIILYNRHPEKIESYREYGAHIAASLKDAVESADYIFLCVKPQNFPDVLPYLSSCNSVSDKVFVTMAAGISMNTVSEAALGAAVVRVMPNTPMLIGKGVIAACRNERTSDIDFDFVCNIFKRSGSVMVIDESEMNRIISVTGSSPAYVFLMIKAMLDGAVTQGLVTDEGMTEKEMIDSICDTIIGAASLMKSGNITPEEQIAVVASKGGTTERAVAELNNRGFCEAIVSAMQKCTDRADELGKQE